MRKKYTLQELIAIMKDGTPHERTLMVNQIYYWSHWLPFCITIKAKIIKKKQVYAFFLPDMIKLTDCHQDVVYLKYSDNGVLKSIFGRRRVGDHYESLFSRTYECGVEVEKVDIER